MSYRDYLHGDLGNLAQFLDGARKEDGERKNLIELWANLKPGDVLVFKDDFRGEIDSIDAASGLRCFVKMLSGPEKDNIVKIIRNSSEVVDIIPCDEDPKSDIDERGWETLRM